MTTATGSPLFKGQPPLPVGRPVTIRKPSPAEKAVLESVGWKPGQPIPAELANTVEQIKREATSVAELRPPVPITTPPVGLPAGVDITTLPEDVQKSYRLLLDDMFKNAAVAQKTAETAKADTIAGAEPGINAAILAGHGIVSPGVAVVTADDVVEQAADDEPRKYCPHCGWPQDQDSATQPGDTDKNNFLQSILGGRQFEKTYEFYAGQVALTFQTLSPAELDAVYKQVTDDIEAKEVRTIVDEREQLGRYMAAAMLKWLVIGGKKVDLSSLSGQSLKERWKHLVANVVKSETMLRHVVITAGEFRQLATKLEVSATNPDFWKVVDFAS